MANSPTTLPPRNRRTLSRRTLAAAPRFEAHGAANTDAPTESELRHRLIERAAYHRAVRRGFSPGGELDDWLAAEQEVNDRLFGGDLALS